MIRPILALTAGGLALVPAGAVALGQYRPGCLPPQPVVYCPPPVVYVPVCPPVCPPVCCQPAVVAPAAPAAPTVHQEAPPTANPPKTEAAPKPASPAVPAPGLPGGLGNKPADSPPAGVKPIGFTEQAPEPKPADPPTIPAAGVPPEPTTPPTRPLVVPAPTPAFKDVTPTAPAPAPPTPAVPSPLTIPSPGATKSDAGLTIPQLKPVAPDAGVPPLTLPTPGEPSTRTSQSSPITGARRSFDVFPVDGPAPASPAALRTVGFFNQSDRAVQLTVEGQSVTLPKGHQVSAVVPAGFKWKLDGGPEQKTDVPIAAPGLDVVIRR